MSEEKKPFSVNIPEDDFVNDIPAPETEVPAEGKPHKVVRYVETEAKAEKTKKEKKKTGIVGEFLAGAAAGAKTVGEGISAGIKTVSEKPAKAEKTVKEKPAKAEKPAKPVKEDETQFPKDEKKKDCALCGILEKVKKLPNSAIIGAAAVILALLIIVILVGATSCSAGGNVPSEEGQSGSGVVIDPVGPSGENGDIIAEDEEPVEIPERKDQFVEAFNANNDVIGWLYIPGLEDVDAGVCFSYDNTYPYNKRDVTGKKVANSYWIEGAYYTHFRNTFGDTAEDLSVNTVIFGHSDLGKENLAYANDDPNGPLFSQLFNFKDPTFAENTPYIYFTLPGEDAVWEVFAVFYNDAIEEKNTFNKYYKKNGGELWYIEPAPVESEYSLMLETVKERSIYDYGVEVTTDDKILTLSTCTIAYGMSGRDNYRFVVVAKLVENADAAQLNRIASFTLNEDASIPSSYKTEFDGYIANWKPSQG